MVKAEIAAESAMQISPEIVKEYAYGLRSLLEEADVVERKSYLTSFVKLR